MNVRESWQLSTMNVECQFSIGHIEFHGLVRVWHLEVHALPSRVQIATEQNPMHVNQQWQEGRCEIDLPMVDYP